MSAATVTAIASLIISATALIGLPLYLNRRGTQKEAAVKAEAAAKESSQEKAVTWERLNQALDRRNTQLQEQHAREIKDLTTSYDRKLADCNARILFLEGEVARLNRQLYGKQ